MRMFNANSMQHPLPPEDLTDYLMNAEKYAYQLVHSTYKNECEVMDDIILCLTYLITYLIKRDLHL